MGSGNVRAMVIDQITITRDPPIESIIFALRCCSGDRAGVPGVLVPREQTWKRRDQRLQDILGFVRALAHLHQLVVVPQQQDPAAHAADVDSTNWCGRVRSPPSSSTILSASQSSTANRSRT